MSVGVKRKLSETSSAARELYSAVSKGFSNPVDETGLSKCFHKVKSRLYLSLAPCHINSPIDGIKQQHLDPMLMTYVPFAKGVLLGYFNVQLSSENVIEEEDGTETAVAKISNDNPFAFLWCTADLLVWRPQIGDVVEGWSYMQSQSHIGLLINDTFNATIKKGGIPPGWRYIPNQVDEYNTENESEKFGKSLGQWLDENEVPVEGKIRFTIKALHAAGKVVSVEGSLIKPGLDKDSQPVVRDGKHRKFADVEEVTVDDEENGEEKDEVPRYQQDDEDEDEDEDNKVVAGDLSSDESDVE
ncbi:hypothetical protein OGAPHI_004419 [Ogataea philodendri]|uniref:DNA-directed RNA polymerase subunit n=1 Tax=Ogataea philodendri TaxID=1378263 RepID=A0A9P8T5M3_9ASCO|nr:uncharacterized protein OGAPHI_004419 [Ogataea philodendri]KAH3666230.1 hypothetical protein OGAPHI_004419 [Ogataea philodendri]